MSAGPVQGRAFIHRFSPATRAVHWAYAIPFLFLLVSGVALVLVPEVRRPHLDGYRLVPLLHIVAGGVLVAGPALAWVLAPRRRAFLQDLRHTFRAEESDRVWPRNLVALLLGGVVRRPAAGKFNTGQKLNAAATVLLGAALTSTGTVLAVNFFTKRVFSAAFVEGLYPWHSVLALLSVPLIAGHIYLAAFNPATRESLRGMVRGVVDRRWAHQHHGRWAAEQEERGRGDA